MASRLVPLGVPVVVVLEVVVVVLEAVVVVVVVVVLALMILDILMFCSLTESEIQGRGTSRVICTLLSFSSAQL
jgi:hypothetical protein